MLYGLVRLSRRSRRNRVQCLLALLVGGLGLELYIRRFTVYVVNFTRLPLPDLALREFVPTQCLRLGLGLGLGLGGKTVEDDLTLLLTLSLTLNLP